MGRIGRMVVAVLPSWPLLPVLPFLVREPAHAHVEYEAKPASVAIIDDPP